MNIFYCRLAIILNDLILKLQLYILPFLPKPKTTAHSFLLPNKTKFYFIKHKKKNWRIFFRCQRKKKQSSWLRWDKKNKIQKQNDEMSLLHLLCWDNVCAHLILAKRPRKVYVCAHQLQCRKGNQSGNVGFQVSNARLPRNERWEHDV